MEQSRKQGLRSPAPAQPVKQLHNSTAVVVRQAGCALRQKLARTGMADLTSREFQETHRGGGERMILIYASCQAVVGNALQPRRREHVLQQLDMLITICDVFVDHERRFRNDPLYHL